MSIQLLIELMVAFPIYILDRLGIKVLPIICSASIELCSCCVLGTFACTMSTVGIGADAGLTSSESVATKTNSTRTFHATSITATTAAN